MIFRFGGLGLAFKSTALVIAVDYGSLNDAWYLLDAYGLAFETLAVEQGGTSLPLLESSDGGNYGLLVINAAAEYDGKSALTTDQWNSLYDYQVKYGVRMVQIDVVRGPDFGTQSAGQCCDQGVEQNLTLVTDVQAKEFPTAGLRAASLSTLGLYHFPASISDANVSTTTAFINFQPAANISNLTVAGVINKFPNGREQMATFLTPGNWSETSTYISHAWIQWGYRGLYQGFRRIHLQSQVDDLFLQTAMYSSGEDFRLRPADVQWHVDWTYDINKRLNNGSSYFSEFGFNANGNLIYNYAASLNITKFQCDSPVFTSWDESTQLEYIKPLGTGIDLWPQNPTFVFFANITNRDAVGLVSHTFTHLELNNATYHDALREIQFNLMYAELLNFTNAARFSGGGLIPPAITGLHNGDTLRAWTDNGLWNAIGDNTRPLLRNLGHLHWLLLTTMAENGFDGYQITPRFATRIYYDCSMVDCDVQQWIDTEDGNAGASIHTLLDIERASVGNQLLSLFHDPYMFHQPNLRQADVQPEVINGKSQKLSLIQMWVETITNELMRLVDWPIITLKHDHIAMDFNLRMIRDSCYPFISYATENNSITGFTLSAATNNSCEVPVPVTIPADIVDTKGWREERVGSDPTTLWHIENGGFLNIKKFHVICIIILNNISSSYCIENVPTGSQESSARSGSSSASNRQTDSHLKDLKISSEGKLVEPCVADNIVVKTWGNPFQIGKEQNTTIEQGTNFKKSHIHNFSRSDSPSTELVRKQRAYSYFHEPTTKHTIVRAPQRYCFGRLSTRQIILIITAIVLTVALAIGLGVGLWRARSSPYQGLTPIWRPAIGSTWQLQLSTPLTGNPSTRAAVYDIDLFDNSAETIAGLHKLGRRVICYFSAGTYENWRPDASQFAAAALGNALPEWVGEQWLDTRATSVRNIMSERIQFAKSKGCDGVDPDNVDGYSGTNRTGFPLTTDDGANYVRWLATAAHSAGLAVGLKNAPEIINMTLDVLDWQLNESCATYEECDLFQPFIEAGKPVFHVEYATNSSAVVMDQACNAPGTHLFSTMLKRTILDAWAAECPFGG